jgi:plasmid maintenance system killer protein
LKERIKPFEDRALQKMFAAEDKIEAELARVEAVELSSAEQAADAEDLEKKYLSSDSE